MTNFIKILSKIAVLVFCLPLLSWADDLAAMEKDCEANQYFACGQLGKNHYDGEGVEENTGIGMKYLKKSDELAQKACEKKDAMACYYTAMLYVNLPDEFKHTESSIKTLYQQSVDLLRTTCAGGNGEDCNTLAGIYEEGNLAIVVNPELTNQFHQQACELKFSDGCYNSALNYSNILNKQKDDTKAVNFYDKACQLGDFDACTESGTIYMMGLGKIEQNDAKAKIQLTKACDSKHNKGCKALEKLNTTSSEKRELEGIKQDIDDINQAFQGVFNVD